MTTIAPSESNPTPAPCCGESCCGGAAVERAAPREAESVRARVREGYAAIARAGAWSADRPAPAGGGCCGSDPAAAGAGGCCGASTITPEQVAAAVGYSRADLEALPEGANLGLSCGNPTALAALRPGEVVLDLGSGAGFDCFIAGPRVGPRGRVIGVDMTPDMIGRARRNLEAYRRTSGLDNVEFRLGEIENLPVADASVDAVISNCVLNLSPDKPRVWREIARVLRPGGRVAISDLALLRPLPEAVRADAEALVGCIAGAALIEDVERMARDAGLVEVRSERRAGYVDAMVNAADPLYASVRARLPAGTRVGDFVASVEFTARKA
jgi:SAM-dependent methyltransferase